MSSWIARSPVQLFLGAVLFCLFGAVAGYADEDHLRFLRALRDRYPDMALEYVQRLDQRRDQLPEAVRAELDLEYASCLVAVAATRPGTEAIPLLDEAARRLQQYIEQHRGQLSAVRAAYQLGQLWIQRGHHELAQARKENDTNRLDVARQSYRRAREVLQEAAEEAEKLLPKESRPRRRRPRRRRDNTEQAVRGLQQFAQLQAALALYHEALTYKPQEPPYQELLEKAIEELDALFQRHRLELTLPALLAHLWHGRCLQKLGKLDDAIDIYDEVLVSEPPNPRSMTPEQAELYAQAYLFRLECMEEKGQIKEILEHPIYAIDDWLRTHAPLANSPHYAAVQFLAARIYLNLAKEEKSRVRRERLYRQALQLLEEVSRVPNPRQMEAARLRRVVEVQLRGREARPETWEEAIALADVALESKSWPEAVRYYEAALAMRKRPEDPLEIARTRYKLAFAYYQAGQVQKAAELAAQCVQETPDAPIAKDAANLALYGLYNAFRQNNDRTVAGRLIELADQVQRLWPDDPVADVARRFMGLVLWQLGRLEEAARAFASVRPESPDYADSLVRAAKVLWIQYARRQSDLAPEDAQALLNRALSFLTRAIEVAPSDRIRIEALLDQTEILLQLGKLEEARQKVDQALELINSTKEEEALAFRLKAYTLALQLASQAGDAEAVQRLVTELEGLIQSGVADVGPDILIYVIAQLTRQYQTLESEARQAQVRQTLESLLTLAEQFRQLPRSAQEYLAEAYFLVGNYERARSLFEALLADADPRSALRYRLRLVACYREAGEYDQAYREVEELVRQYESQGGGVPVSLLVERARLVHAWAERDAKRWRQAYRLWAELYNALVRRRPRPREFYEAVYGLGEALLHLGRPAEARRLVQRTLLGSRTAGGPELRKQLEDLLQRLQASGGRTAQ